MQSAAKRKGTAVSEAQFTPGPWSLEDRTVYALEHHGWRKGVETFRNRFHASVTPTENTAETKANACLIAAAPDLYAACQLALDAFEKNWAIDWSELSKALAKARGEV